MDNSKDHPRPRTVAKDADKLCECPNCGHRLFTPAPDADPVRDFDPGPWQVSGEHDEYRVRNTRDRDPKWERPSFVWVRCADPNCKRNKDPRNALYLGSQ